MRAWLLVCAALAFAPGPTSATAAHPSRLREERVKEQILAKLGLSSRPTPLRAPPRDVVRKILQRAADPAPAHTEPQDMREIIAIAHRGWDVKPALPAANKNKDECPNNKIPSEDLRLTKKQPGPAYRRY